MTHSAKGFPLVFGRPRGGLFPSHKSVEEPGRLEEERRLAYVGITRARTHLILCYAETRRMHGMEMYGRPSRFLGEIPRELLHEIRPRVQVSRPSREGQQASPGTALAGLKLDQRVRHAHFGEGVIIDYEGSGAHARAGQLRECRAKWLVSPTPISARSDAQKNPFVLLRDEGSLIEGASAATARRRKSSRLLSTASGIGSIASRAFGRIQRAEIDLFHAAAPDRAAIGR
jgi:hypothetical protein